MATCVISGQILNLDGTAVASVQVVATLESAADDMSGQVVDSTGVTITPIEVFTDEDGEFEITLLRNARVLLSIPTINLRKYITVPDADTAIFTELI